MCFFLIFDDREIRSDLSSFDAIVFVGWFLLVPMAYEPNLVTGSFLADVIVIFRGCLGLSKPKWCRAV